MAVSATCLNALKEFECAFRDNSLNYDGLCEKLDSFFLVNGDIPTELENIELLDAFATYFTQSCEDDIKMMIFHLIFPFGLNSSRLRDDFLIKLTQLSLCIGIAPILDLVSVRLKIQVCVAIKSLETNQDCISLLDDNLLPTTRLISHFIHGVLNGVLSVSGLDADCEASLQSADFLEVSVPEHPLLNVSRLSPLFLSALISGITLVYVASLIQDKQFPSSSPPLLLLRVLLVWLGTTRLKNTRTDWASVDWESYLTNVPPRVLEPFAQMLRCSIHNLPLLVADTWPVACGLVFWTVLVAEKSGAGVDAVNPREGIPNIAAIDNLFSELHYELLKNFALPLPRGKFSRGSAALSDRSLSTWRLKYPADLLPITEYLRNVPLSHFSPDNTSEDREAFRLSVLRLTEIIKLSWSNDRLLNCDLGDIIKLLKPFNSFKIVQLSCQALRR